MLASSSIQSCRCRRHQPVLLGRALQQRPQEQVLFVLPVRLQQGRRHYPSNPPSPGRAAPVSSWVAGCLHGGILCSRLPVVDHHHRRHHRGGPGTVGRGYNDRCVREQAWIRRCGGSLHLHDGHGDGARHPQRFRSGFQWGLNCERRGPPVSQRGQRGCPLAFRRCRMDSDLVVVRRKLSKYEWVDPWRWHHRTPRSLFSHRCGGRT